VKRLKFISGTINMIHCNMLLSKTSPHSRLLFHLYIKIHHKQGL